MHAGAWADRRGRRRQTMIACDLGRFALLATIPACWALDVLTLWQLHAVVVRGGDAVHRVQRGEQHAVRLDRRAAAVRGRAVADLRQPGHVVRGGPSLGGLLAQLLTAPFAIVADALSFLGSAFFLARIGPAEPPASDGKGGVTEGLRFIARSPIVRASLIGVAVVNFFNLMFFALFMLYAVRMLHVCPGCWAWCSAAARSAACSARR